MNEIFVERNSNYTLRGNNVLTRRKANSVRYATETVSFLAPKIWDILLKDLMDSESRDIFKRKIKKWSSENQRYLSFTKLTSIRFSIIVKMLV